MRTYFFTVMGIITELPVFVKLATERKLPLAMTA